MFDSESAISQKTALWEGWRRLLRFWPWWASPALLALSTLAMVFWSWGTWTDAVVDFGRETYIPWQMTEGKVLYRDMAYFNGPLSPCLNAVWFTCFGTSLRTLMYCNLALLALILALLYAVFCQIASRLAATAACLVFITVFAFGEYVGMSNYNYVWPYSHEMTHGLLLGLLCIWCLWRYLKSCRLGYVSGAGVMTGLVVLTRPEMATATVGALAGGGVLILVLQRPRLAQIARSLAAFGIPALLIVLGAFLLLWRQLSAAEAARGIAGGWLWVFDRRITDMSFYQDSMGLSDIGSNLAALAEWVGWYLLVLLPTALLCLLARRPGGTRWAWVPAGVCALTTVAVVAWRWRQITWGNLPRPLPLIMLILAIPAAAALWRSRARQPQAAAPVLRLVMILFAGLLLPKMLLFARIGNYGFVFGVPAAMLTVVALLDWIPAWIIRHGGGAGVFRILAAGVLVTTVASHMFLSHIRYASHVFPVASGADAFLGDARGGEVEQAMQLVRQTLRPGQTLAVIPQGLMINYLLRRVNPVPYANIMPPEVANVGEDCIVEAWRRTPPDYILVVSRGQICPDGFLYGRELYARKFRKWMNENYLLLGALEAPPSQQMRQFIGLLRYRGPKAGGESH